VNNSWTLGKVAQLQNPLLVSARNWLMSVTPARAADRQFQFIYNVSLG
jgi:FAD-dependent urate hydroxylase